MGTPAFAEIKALIVDDFDNFRITVMQMLQNMGITYVDSAINGKDALRKCRDTLYDVLLCDYNLGPGKSGQQVLEQLRQNGGLKHSSLFILISAESSKSIVMAACDYQPDAYLTKPITAKTLQQRLERLLRLRATLLPIYQALDDSDSARAIALCRGFIQSDSRCRSHCQKLLGNLLLKHHDYQEAEALYKEVLAVRELDWAQVGLASAYLGQNRLPEAEQWVEQALASNPLCVKAYDIWAQINAAREDARAEQQVLERAVDLSPLSLKRQQDLGVLALANQDVATATEALRRSVKLGEHSCYDREDIHLQFIRAGTELNRRDPDKASGYNRDLSRVVSGFANRFGTERDNKLALVSAAASYKAAIGESAAAQRYAQQAREYARERDVPLAVKLDWLNCADTLGETAERDYLMSELLEQYKHDQRSLECIDRLVENPVSAKNSRRVADINRRGIARYDSQDFAAAIEDFEQAVLEFPRHMGVALNLLQALLGALAVQPTPDLLARAETVDATLNVYITAEHPQLRRYRQLQHKLQLQQRQAAQALGGHQ